MEKRGHEPLYKKRGHEPHSLENITAFDESGNNVIHYTCNAPDEKTLLKNNIYPVGRRYGCANNTEVVIIPKKTLEKAIGRKASEDPVVLSIDCEHALRNIDRKDKKNF